MQWHPWALGSFIKVLSLPYRQSFYFRKQLLTKEVSGESFASCQLSHRGPCLLFPHIPECMISSSPPNPNQSWWARLFAQTPQLGRQGALAWTLLPLLAQLTTLSSCCARACWAVAMPGPAQPFLASGLLHLLFHGSKMTLLWFSLSVFFCREFSSWPRIPHPITLCPSTLFMSLTALILLCD